MEIDDLPEREKAKTASSGMAFAESLSSPLSAIGLKRSMLRSKNLTFLLGAGFSHSWDNRFPTGSRLFHFRRDEWQAQAPAVADFIRLTNCTSDAELTADAFKDIIYLTVMMKRYPSIRPRYVDDGMLDLVERELRYIVLRKFEQCAPIYSGTGHEAGPAPALNPHQTAIYELIRLLRVRSVASSGNLRLNFLTTNYDFTIETILRRVDPGLIVNLYRGITPISVDGDHEHIAMPYPENAIHLLKINGGFEVFRSAEQFEFDYRPRDDLLARLNPPQIMLPSREQNYEQPYFQALFPKVARLLHESHVLVVVGYSVPEEDALLRLIIRQFGEDPLDGEQRVVFFVDLEDEGVQWRRLKTIFPQAGTDNAVCAATYSGHFSDWCADALTVLQTR
jgi:hypothetical protein